MNTGLKLREYKIVAKKAFCLIPRDFDVPLMTTNDSKNPRRDIWLVVEISRDIWLSIGRRRGTASIR